MGIHTFRRHTRSVLHHTRQMGSQSMPITSVAAGVLDAANIMQKNDEKHKSTLYCVKGSLCTLPSRSFSPNDSNRWPKDPVDVQSTDGR